MIEISHESPIAILDESRRYNDLDYALVHLLETEPVYLQFFKDSIAQGRKVILDNSIFELGTAFDSDKFADWVEELRPTEYIIPDVLEDSEGTIRSAQKFIAKYKDLPGKSIGVVQGKTLDEIEHCYYMLDKVFNVDKIAISFDYSLYRQQYPHPNKWVSFALGRVKVMQYLVRRNIINVNKPHHLLGCSLPIEFMFYKSDFNWIESMDSSNPVVHGLLGINYKGYGLDDKQSIKLVDLIHHEVDETALKNIWHNVNIFKEIVNG